MDLHLPEKLYLLVTALQNTDDSKLTNPIENEEGPVIAEKIIIKQMCVVKVKVDVHQKDLKKPNRYVLWQTLENTIAESLE